MRLALLKQVGRWDLPGKGNGKRGGNQDQREGAEETHFALSVDTILGNKNRRPRIEPERRIRDVETIGSPRDESSHESTPYLLLYILDFPMSERERQGGERSWFCSQAQLHGVKTLSWLAASTARQARRLPRVLSIVDGSSTVILHGGLSLLTVEAERVGLHNVAL